MKTKFILLMFIGIGCLNHLRAAQLSKDSVENSLQDKMKQLEIHVQTLQAEIRLLKSTDSIHQSEMRKLKQSLRSTAPRKLVISRRGSKQASIQ